MPDRIGDILGYGRSVFSGVEHLEISARKRVFATGSAVLGAGTTGFITVTTALQAPDDVLTSQADGILLEALTYDVFASAGVANFTLGASRCVWATKTATLILPAGILDSTGLTPAGGGTAGVTASLTPTSPGGLYLAQDLQFAAMANSLDLFSNAATLQPLQLNTIITATIAAGGAGDTINVSAFMWYRHIRGLTD